MSGSEETLVKWISVIYGCLFFFNFYTLKKISFHIHSLGGDGHVDNFVETEERIIFKVAMLEISPGS